MAAIFPVCTCTLVLFLTAEKYDAFPASTLDEAGCSLLAPGLHKAGKPPSLLAHSGSLVAKAKSHLVQNLYILSVFFQCCGGPEHLASNIVWWSSQVLSS